MGPGGLRRQNPGLREVGLGEMELGDGAGGGEAGRVGLGEVGLRSQSRCRGTGLDIGTWHGQV